MKAIRLTTVLAATAALLYASVTLVREVWDLIRVDTAVSRALSGEARSSSLSGVSGLSIDSTAVDFGNLSRAIVLVFDPLCGPCNLNMSNWVDLLVETPADIPVIAIGIVPADSARTYWGTLARRVTIMQMDTARLVDSFQVQSTPTLLLIRDGSIVRRFDGMLAERSRRSISDILAAPREGSIGAI